MSNNTVPTAQVMAKPRFSLIWLIPLIAALIGGWLAYKYYTERGTMVVISFDKAAGIEPRKTIVRYKDVEVGIVRKVGLSPDLKEVRATVEIYNDMEANLGPETQFWIVSPRVTLRGISGLQTLLSGVNIGMEPGPPGEALSYYDGLSEAPNISINEDGQSFVLTTERLGSLDIGSPVHYRQIKVGEVTGYKLNPDSEKIDVNIFIFAPYHEKVRTNSRFWNSSGFELDVSTVGVTARLESLTSLLIGGISFNTDFNRAGYPVNGKTAFRLYDNFKLAREDTINDNKLLYTLYFEDSLQGLRNGAPIKFQGIKLGQVENISLAQTPDDFSIRTKLDISLYIDQLSPTGSRIESEKLLQGLVEKGLRAQIRQESLITGAKFIALTMRPEEADHITLARLDSGFPVIFPTTKAAGSITEFDPTAITKELNTAIRSATALMESNDVKNILGNLASTTKSIDTITAELARRGVSGEVMTLLKEASNTARTLQTTLGDASKTMIDARVMMQSAGKAATALTGTAGTLQKDISVALVDIRRLANQLTKSTGILEKDASRAMIDARVMMQSAGKAATSLTGNAATLQKDVSAALIDARVMMQNIGKSAVALQKDTSRTLGSINKATNTVERGINATLSEDSAMQYRFQQLINDLSEAANSFSVLADTLQRKPNSLILGK